MQIAKLMACPTGYSIRSFLLPLLQNVEVTVDANIAQSVATECGERVSYAHRVAVGEYSVHDEIEAVVRKSSNRAVHSPAHRISEAAHNLFWLVRNEPIGFNVQEGPFRSLESMLKRP